MEKSKFKKVEFNEDNNYAKENKDYLSIKKDSPEEDKSSQIENLISL